MIGQCGITGSTRSHSSHQSSTSVPKRNYPVAGYVSPFQKLPVFISAHLAPRSMIGHLLLYQLPMPSSQSFCYHCDFLFWLGSHIFFLFLFFITASPTAISFPPCPHRPPHPLNDADEIVGRRSPRGSIDIFAGKSWRSVFGRTDSHGDRDDDEMKAS